MASESPLLSELHDAYVLCSSEQLDFFAACCDATEHEYENGDGRLVGDILAAKGDFK